MVWVPALLAAAAGVALDWWSKGAAFAYHLEANGLLAERHPMPLWDIFGLRVSLVREYNSGIAGGIFGAMPDSHVYLGAMRFAVVVGIGALAWRLRHHGLRVMLAFAGIAAGAAGNLLDNIFHDEFQHEHTVRDFVLISLKQHHLPAFNLADVLVAAGTGYLLIVAARTHRSAPHRGSGGPTGDRA